MTLALTMKRMVEKVPLDSSQPLGSKTQVILRGRDRGSHQPAISELGLQGLHQHACLLSGVQTELTFDAAGTSSAFLLVSIPQSCQQFSTGSGEESQEPQGISGPGRAWGAVPRLCLGCDFCPLGQNCREAETMPGSGRTDWNLTQ